MGLTLSEAVEKMRGPVDSDIKLTIQRGNTEPFEVTLTRAVIKIQSVRSRLEGGDIAYIRITSFSEQTDTGLETQLKRLKEQAKGKLIGIVLDLRNNPGGLLDQAVAVSDAFLDKGEIVSTRGRHEDDAQRYNARAGDIADGLPIVVLINGGSASASEIVAGALQDHHRAILLGTKSFGKGSVQTIIPVPGHGAIRLTTARYFTPSGRSIQALGIDPDIVAQQAKVEIIEPQRRIGEADLKGALENPDQAPPTATTPQDPNSESSGNPPGASTAPVAPGTAPPDQEDFQLARALDLLRGISLFRTSQMN
jgi:carboxyl-terminal processing protease